MSALEYDIRQFSMVDKNSKKSLCRGIPVILPNNFLMAPTFRTVLNHETDELIEFTVSLNRQNEKLGITILEVDGEIIIHNLLWKNENEKIPSLAMKAGVRVGDFLTGINNEYFSPGVEVQDVIDMLQLYGKYITLHFSRYHKRVYNNRKFSYTKNNTDQSQLQSKNNLKSSIGTGLSLQHKCTQILIEQNVITPDRATNVSIALIRLKQRVLEWDSGYISQRINHYNLDKYSHYHSQNLNNNATTPSLSPSSSSPSMTGTINKRRSSSSSSSTSRRSSASSVGAIYDNFSSPDSFSINSNNISNITTDIEETDQQQQQQQQNGINMNDGISIPSDSSSSSSSTITKTLRPALSIYVLHAEERQSHTVYVIWVMDIRSGLEWIVTRRFREFHEFHDLLVDIRPSLSRIEFPSKKLNITETANMITERLQLFQKFLRRISSLVCINSLHPSTAKVLLAFQDFLAVNDRILKTLYVEENSDIVTLLQNTVQVYMHSIVHMNVMDKIFIAYTDTFRDMCNLDSNHSVFTSSSSSSSSSSWIGSITPSTNTINNNQWTEEKGRQLLESIRTHIDNLQDILFDGVYDDCRDIVTRLLRKHQRSIEAELYAKEQIHHQRNKNKNSNNSNSSNDNNDVGNSNNNNNNNNSSSSIDNRNNNNNSSSSSSSSSRNGNNNIQNHTHDGDDDDDDDDLLMNMNGNNIKHTNKINMTKASQTSSSSSSSIHSPSDSSSSSDTIMTIPLATATAAHSSGSTGAAEVYTSFEDMEKGISSDKEDVDRDRIRTHPNDGDGDGDVYIITSSGHNNNNNSSNNNDHSSNNNNNDSNNNNNNSSNNNNNNDHSSSNNNNNSNNNNTNINNNNNNNNNDHSSNNNINSTTNNNSHNNSSNTNNSNTNKSNNNNNNHTNIDIIAEHFTEYDIRGLVKSAIRKQIEIEIFIPCLTSLRTILKRSFRQSENHLQLKMSALFNQSQSYYGIHLLHQSNSNWIDVIHLLKTIRSHLLPHDKLTTLVSVARLIPVIYQKEHPLCTEPLGADEFLPIFLYILVQSELMDLVSLKEELQALCDPDKKLAEFGYYLATLEASIHHISEADTSAESLFPFLTTHDDDDDDEDTTTTNKSANEDDAAERLS